VDLHALRHRSAIAGALGGVKPVIVAIVLHAAWRIGRRTLRHASLWAIAIVAFLALQVSAFRSRRSSSARPWLASCSSVSSRRRFASANAHAAAWRLRPRRP
jgi:chromate transporter